MSTAFQAQVISLICEGVFEQFPSLKIVLIEGGFAWAPPLAWRLDSAWSKLRIEVPHLRRLPSEYFAEHFWLTTQPMEEPHRPTQFLELLEQAPWLHDRLMFSTDYPHWDFDAPDQALAKVQLPAGFAEKLMAENARALYGL
jgi:predicted TIM-barrel fold metal-dependent hydrolase